MFSEKAMSFLLKSINAELENANKWGEDFSSNHEAYAVLKEEVEEASEELDNIKSALNIYWHSIRVNANKNCMEGCIRNLKRKTLCTIKELIQVYVVCCKTLRTIKKEK